VKASSSEGAVTRDEGVRIYVGIGSNTGRSRETVVAAMEALRRRLDHFACSSIYRSDAMYVPDQPSFLNAVVTGLWKNQSVYGAEALLAELLAIERHFGRNRAQERRHGPRCLDLDLLLFGDVILDTSTLSVPHPRMEERLFVLAPLVELNGRLRNPRSGRYFSEVLTGLPDQGVERVEACPLGGSDATIARAGDAPAPERSEAEY
jgi:2-amino-4-hydroxy-6-hydroxymethyldihydropteridine diphosphokinase